MPTKEEIRDVYRKRAGNYDFTVQLYHALRRICFPRRGREGGKFLWRFLNCDSLRQLVPNQSFQSEVCRAARP
jgi:hypothetical protein